MTYRLVRQQFLPRPRAEVFAFFSDARNLQEITPPWLHFRMLSDPPRPVTAGTLIDYRLRLFGVPFRWRTRIETVDPPHSFTDTQVRGPYALWHHTHLFEEVEGGTLMRDSVRYRLRFGPCGRLAHPLLVKRSLRKIFDYRRKVLAEKFGT